jgi:hypothetical protein
MNQERRMTRLLAAAAAALLGTSACGDAEQPSQGADAKIAAAAGDDRIECATGGDDGFERVCTLERQSGAEGIILVLRAPDGGFRRLRVTSDGQGVVVADGAEPAVVTPLGPELIEVSIGRDRYRLPATVGPATS